VFISQALFSQLTVCAVEHRVYSIVSRSLYIFSSFSCDLHFLFFYFIERFRWRSVFPWLRFVDQILCIRFSSASRAQQSRKGYDKQKAVVVV